MLKTRIILIAACAIIIWLIFLLPKVVVENESQMKGDSTAEAKVAAPASHSNSVPEKVAGAIKKYRAEFAQSSSNEKNAIFADSLQNLYAEAGQFDSAAWFAEKAATFFNTTESFLKAGDRYYDAFTFALKPEKQTAMAEKAREWLGKAVSANPKNLEARTKIGMTYLSSSPMQGVKMLREVLAEDPKNELALFNLGMLSIQSGQYDKAIDRLKELIAVNPNHVQGQLLLGVAFMNTNEKEKARQQFEKVKQLDKDPAVQSTADSYLKDLK